VTSRPRKRWGAGSTAPFGRRIGEVVSNGRLGAYTLLTVSDNGPRPEPGQFYMLASAERWGGGRDERPYLPRAFSHARVREDGSLDFLLEAVGPGTERLAELKIGEGVWLTGPLGIGFRPPSEGRTPLLVGGGIGTAPLLCLHDEIGPDVPVLLGFRSAAHAEASRLFRGAPPQIATDDGSVGHAGLVTELLRDRLDNAEVYACGPPPMLEAVRAMCAERDVPAQLAMESGMACGFGACFGCVVPTKQGYVRLCVDGPVLEARDLETAITAGAGH
jgi:dihydroorotate dehydrogenase electron transfer subunit